MAKQFKEIFILWGLFIVGSLGLFALLPTLWLQFLFIVVIITFSVFVFWKKESLDFNTLALITTYVLSVAQFGWHFYFHLNGWIVLFFTFLWTSFIFWLGFRYRIGRLTGSAKVLSLTSGLVAAEIALSLLYWPTHFLI